MSVVSKNPFDLLGDDGEPSPAPAPAKSAAQPKAQAAPAPQRTVPGAAPRGNANRGRGGARGGRPQGEQRNTGPTSGDVQEGFEHPAGFDGERVPASKKAHKGPDAHTKGPRENRPIRNPTSGGHSSRGGQSGKARTPNNAGERRQFERKSGTLPDSQKKVEHGWGADDGEAELNAEQQGEKDAQDEENAPQTPAAEKADGGWGAAEGEATVAPAAPVEEEEEEITKSYDEYLAERAATQNSTFGKKEGRQVNNETVEGTQFRREGIDDFFSGKEKAAKARTTTKKEKVFIEFDGQFASPAGAPSGDRGGRGGRGGDRGRGGRGGGRGGERGARGTGAGRGAPRGRAAPRGGRSGAVDANDEKAFPALGA